MDNKKSFEQAKTGFKLALEKLEVLLEQMKNHSVK